ncbi:MAG: paraquat-inducible protein A [Gemmatimonadaceae bacterium]
MMKTPRNILAVILTLVSLGLLWPGLTEPVLTITASIKLLGPPKEIFRQSQSIVQSVRTLWNGGNMFVAGLIVLFSITVPFIKAVILLVIFTSNNAATQTRLFRFVRSVSKWAMADVFVVGIFIAFLAANAISNLHAAAERGFYFFAAYCLVSNVAFALLELPDSASSSA